jgi:hypothetical protein
MRKIVYGILAVAVMGAALVYTALWMEQRTSGVLEGYSRNSYHIYTLAPGAETRGSSYTIPPTLAEGTNLSTDSYISYEESDSVSCKPSDFLNGASEVEEVTDDGVTYLVAYSLAAAAGNRYDETVYVFKDYEPCNAVRYHIHYTEIGNYPEGTVREFDRAALVAQFDQIRRELAQSR